MFGENEKSTRQIEQYNTRGAYFGRVFRYSGISRTFNLQYNSSLKGGAGYWKSEREANANRSDHVQTEQNPRRANLLRSQT